MDLSVIDKLKEADNMYAAGKPIMSDFDYDELREDAEKHFPDHPYFQTVGALDISYRKAKHVISLGSLHKLRPDTGSKFLLDYPTIAWCVFDKYDGVSLSLRYINGKLEQALTRGNGNIGQDVTHAVRDMTSVPKEIAAPADDMIIMGEAIISRKNTEKLPELGYANARNAVAAVFRRPDHSRKITKTRQLVDFICWRVWEKAGVDWAMLPEHKREKLELGFPMAKNLVPYENANSAKLTPEVLDDLVKKSMDKDQPYACDGIVLSPARTRDKSRIGALNTTLPAWAAAVKMDIYAHKSLKGRISHIEWEIGFSGRLSPVGHLVEPLNFNGFTISRVSIHNYARVKELHVGRDSEVEVIHSGEVIPHVINATRAFEIDAPKTCPHCGSNLMVDKLNLVCKNIDNCSGIAYARLVNYVTMQKIRGIGVDTATRLTKAGYPKIEDIFRISIINMRKILGKKRGEVFHKAIRRWRPTEPELAAASGLFSSYPDILGIKRLEAIHRSITEGKRLSEVRGAGPKSLAFYERRLPAFEAWRKKVPIKTRSLPSYNRKLPLDGKAFCMTGFKSKELEEVIRVAGGTVSRRLTGKTVAMFGGLGSPKYDQARAMGIKIMPAEDAMDYVNKLIAKV